MRSLVLLVALTGHAAAEPAREVQADVGLSVVLVAYELPVAPHVSVDAGAGIFGTYFLPWFDLGQNVQGLALGGRVTWFARDNGSGFYVAPYVRCVGVRGDVQGMTSNGLGFTAGVFAGWAFRLTDHVDLRVGAGAQYLRFQDTSTPFVALDALVGYRL